MNKKEIKQKMKWLSDDINSLNLAREILLGEKNNERLSSTIEKLETIVNRKEKEYNDLQELI